ncbi:MAG: LysM peptidoglycan-binding domain-containing protein [Pseudomonadota bacterium]
MKLFKGIKFTALIAMVLSLAVGCASTPQEEEAPADDPVATAEAAIADAKSAQAEAKAAGYAWRDTDLIIKGAEEALADGDTGRAIQLAETARRQAENALAQQQIEEDRLADLAADSAASDDVADDSYTVVSGDSLWAISGKGSVYGNPYQWPLIYKANRDKIEDADLIFPGQQFSIERGASSAEIDAAVNHAKTRGEWSLGVAEESDMEYLNR